MGGVCVDKGRWGSGGVGGNRGVWSGFWGSSNGVEMIDWL